MADEHEYELIDRADGVSGRYAVGRRRRGQAFWEFIGNDGNWCATARVFTLPVPVLARAFTTRPVPVWGKNAEAIAARDVAYNSVADTQQRPNA